MVKEALKVIVTFLTFSVLVAIVVIAAAIALSAGSSLSP